jgi:HAE1 family hydrophobic/amphiphilic exporter-1
VFIPVAFMKGITGRLYQQFAITIAVSVLISAFNALTLSPALCALLLRPRSKAAPGWLARLGAKFNRGFDGMNVRYVSINRFLVRKLAIPLVLLAGVAIAAALVGRGVASGFVPDEDQGYLVIGVQLPDGASLERTHGVYAQIDAILAKQAGVEMYNGIGGFSFFTQTAASYTGTGFASLAAWDKRKSKELQSTAIADQLNAKFSGITEARVFAVGAPAIPGISAAGGFSMMLQDRTGNSYEFLAKNVARFLAEAGKRPELAGVRPNFVPAVPQLFAEVDKEKALKEGVPITEVYNALQTFLGGSYINDFTRFGRQWRVFLQADSSYRTSAEDIRRFYVRSAVGTMIPLSSFVRVRATAGPEYTVRFNLYRAVEIMGAQAPGYSTGQALDALEDVARKTLPPEMGYAWNGLSFQEKAASGGTAGVLGLSLVFVFLILAALYESWSLPFSVLLSVPVAVLGALLGLLARHFDNNVFAQIGLVMLVGLTAKNAILIVEFAKAELEGAKRRLRPILMTSLAFILGCVPLWIATGAGAASRRMIGTVVISGMLAATALGIYFIPALFVAVERLAGKKKQADPAKAEPPKAEPPKPPAPVAA